MTIEIYEQVLFFGGGFFLGLVAGMYIHYYHGESLANDGDKNVQ